MAEGQAPLEKLSTKHRGDIAEYRVVAELLERGYNVLMPCGDRLPYDVAVDVDGRLVRLQVRRAWRTTEDRPYQFDIRRSQTNRAVYKHSKHALADHDFFVGWIPGTTSYYVVPADVTATYGSAVVLSHRSTRNINRYLNAWDLIRTPTACQS